LDALTNIKRRVAPTTTIEQIWASKDIEIVKENLLDSNVVLPFTMRFSIIYLNNYNNKSKYKYEFKKKHDLRGHIALTLLNFYTLGIYFVLNI